MNSLIAFATAGELDCLLAGRLKLAFASESSEKKSFTSMENN